VSHGTTRPQSVYGVYQTTPSATVEDSDSTVSPPSHHPSPVVSSVLEMKSYRVADQHNSIPVIVDNMVIRRWRKTVNSPNFYMQSLFKAPLGVTF